MNYNKEVLENSTIKYTVDVATEDWKKALVEAYNKNKNRFTVEGFRKGKAPMSVITRMYGTGVFFEDALDIVIPNVYAQILKEDTEVQPVARPDFDIVAISDTDLKLMCIITVKPEFTLGQYKGLELEAVSSEVTEDMIAAELLKAQEKAGAWENIDNRPAEKFDTVVIDYSGSVDGVKFDGGTAEKQNLELGSGMFIPGFEEQVEGMSIGEEKDVVVTFPAEYGVEELAGKEAVFAVKLHEIKHKALPELNDEFVKDVSEFDTLDEYKANIKTELAHKAEINAKREMEDKLMETIVTGTEIKVPEAMILDEVENMVDQFEYRLSSQGLNPQDYYKYTGSTREELKLKYNDSAVKTIKTRLVLEAIINAENITATEAEMDDKIAEFAKSAGKEFEEYKKEVTPQEAQYVENMIVTDKVIDFLMANNKFA